MVEDYKQKWQKCLDLIRSNVDEECFRTWFAVAEPKGFANNRLLLKLPTHGYLEKYEDDFYEILTFALRHVFGQKVTLEYEYNVIGSDRESAVKVLSPEKSHVINSKMARRMESAPVEERLPLFDSQLKSDLNFENYCVGQSNMLPYTIADHISSNPEKVDFNPFFLYGNVGVGKTHLIQAIGIRIKERYPRAKVLFISMRQFQNLYANASQKGEIPEFINWYQRMDAILFDDLQELSGKVGTAGALFPIFNHLHQNNKKLIFACDRPPQELDGISDRLIDRFKWGVTEPLLPPDYELRKKILKFKARTSGLDLNDDIVSLIAENASGSVRELEGIVRGLYVRAIELNAPISLALAEEVVSHSIRHVEKKSINFDMIVENTAEFYHLNPDAIFSKSRLRDIADARQMVMYLCKKHTSLSSPAIGARLNRNHATVLHGISTVTDRLEVSPEVAKAVEQIEKALFA